MEQGADNSSELFDGWDKKGPSSKRTILFLLLCCIIAALVLYFIMPVREGVKDFWGRPQTKEALRQNFKIALLFSYPLLSLVLGAMTSFIPYKQKNYREKYLLFSVIILLAIYVLTILARLASLILIYSRS